MRNDGLDEAQAGIKIAGRNINNLNYSDNTTLMAESEEELKSLLLEGVYTGTKYSKDTEIKLRNQRANCQHPLDLRKSKRIPKKHLLLLH